MAASRTLMALAITATMVVELAMATNYTVGDSGGWEIGPNFQSWASSKKFFVGDVLIFEYSANHDVVEVMEVDFSSCLASNPIKKHTDGSTAIILLTPGKRFFICGVPGHCSAGMKVEIDTFATPSLPPSSAETPPAPPPEVTPSSPPPSSSPAAPSSPLAPPPSSNASPPAPPTGPTSPAPAPTPESPIPPFPFDLPLNPSGDPTTPPPSHSSAYKCSFRVHLSVGFSLIVIMLLAL